MFLLISHRYESFFDDSECRFELRSGLLYWDSLCFILLVSIFIWIYLNSKTSKGLKGQLMFDKSNFGTNLWTSGPNVKFGTKFGWTVNFGTM